MKKLFLALSPIFLLALPTQAHDLWLQTNAQRFSQNEVVHIDLMLGNHGNDHRDFKLTGKPDLETSTIRLITPKQKHIDLKPNMKDMGYTPKEGFWTTRFFPSSTGLHQVTLLNDAIMTYAPIRSIKSAKTFFVVANTTDDSVKRNSDYNKAMGAPLELVPVTNPITAAKPGGEIKAQLLLNKKPLKNTKVSFIPRGVTLKEGFDEEHEARTDQNGFVSFKIHEANYYLMVAQTENKELKGPGYDSTSYSATLTLYVP